MALHPLTSLVLFEAMAKCMALVAAVKDPGRYSNIPGICCCFYHTVETMENVVNVRRYTQESNSTCSLPDAHVTCSQHNR